MSIISDFDDVVFQFVQDYPLLVTYVQQTDGVYNPATGSMSSTTTETEVDAILLDLTLSSNGLSTRHGTAVIAGDKQLLVRPPNKKDPLAPALVINTATDRVQVPTSEGVITFKIVTFKEINPTGNDPILFDLYIRR